MPEAVTWVQRVAEKIHDKQMANQAVLLDLARSPCHSLLQTLRQNPGKHATL